jgi:ubiquinone/menaquinone biosynthesis C-methylase UbiE
LRELARRTAGANRLIGRDMSPYLLREARALARRDRLLDHIDFGEGRAEALPLPDSAVDVALSSTVFEEGDAELCQHGFGTTWKCYLDGWASLSSASISN